MVYIYILELENNKYYIGKSNIPDIRIENHLNNNGSEYTKLHKPIRLIEIISDCDDYDEDKYTLQYMDKYGINNVRGGSFSEIQFSEEHIKIINRMINGAKNQCFLCGSKTHFVKNCDKKDEVVIKFVDGKCTCAASFISSHRKSKCSLKKVFDIFDNFTNMIADEDDDKPFYDKDDEKEENKKSVQLPWKLEEFQGVAGSRQKISKSNIKKRSCYRCGREGHYASSCYAKYNKKGKYIK